MKKQIKEDYNNDTATGFAWDFLQVKVTVNLSSYGVFIRYKMKFSQHQLHGNFKLFYQSSNKAC